MVFHRVCPIIQSIPIIHLWPSESYVSNPIICWWLYLAVIHIFLQTPKPEVGKWLMWRCHRTPNFWSFFNFRLRQKKNMFFNASKTQFFHLSSQQQKSPDNYPFYFNDKHLSLSSTLNIFELSFTKTVNWKSYISPLAKSDSKKLSVLCRLHQFFSPYQLLTLYRGLIRPCMEYTSHVWEGLHAQSC